MISPGLNALDTSVRTLLESAITLGLGNTESGSAVDRVRAGIHEATAETHNTLAITFSAVCIETAPHCSTWT